MKNGIIYLMIFCCVIVMFCCAACLHDLQVLREYNNRLQAEIWQISIEQEAQSKEMRVMKTNNEIVFDMVINKEWEK
jgi:hypothetical protein